MPTKVDTTASMLCRRAGCSSAELAQRVIVAENEALRYRSALQATCSPHDGDMSDRVRQIAENALRLETKGESAK